MPDLQPIVAAMTFTGIRIGGLMVFAPFTGSDAISPAIKAVLTLLVTAVVYPVAAVTAVHTDLLGWIRVAGGEAVIGLSLGLVVQFSFEAAQFAGQIFGIQTGFSLVTLLDPQSQADSPSLVVFTRLIALLAFLEMNVHHWLLRSVSASFAYLPPGALGSMRWLNGGVTESAAGLWLAGLQMAAPVLGVTVLADVTLGLLGKVAPQFPATLAGLPLKNILGLGVIAVGARAWPRVFEREFMTAMEQAERVLHLAR